MDFYTALSTHGNSEAATQEFAVAFLTAVTADPENYPSKLSHYFVGQCFRVLGLRFTVSLTAFSETQDHPYRNDNPNYIFDPSPQLMENVQSFFLRLPVLFSTYAPSLTLDVENNRFDRLTHPVSAYLRVVVIWMKVVHSICGNMQLAGATSLDRYLCEPVARMSFYIMNGLAELLPGYVNFDGLKEICLSLAIDVRYGIFYKSTSDLIVLPMLDMFEEHYKVFCGVEKSALDFVFCVLTVAMDDPTNYVEAYEFLEAMLEQFKNGERDESNNMYLRMFTNELITDKYMFVIFDTLNTSRSKRLLLAVLWYLMSLQKHLVSIDCISISFHEVLLRLLLRTPPVAASVTNEAAKLYVTLSERKYHRRDITLHILETFIKCRGNSRRKYKFEQFRGTLSKYLKVLGQYLPVLHLFETYAVVVIAQNVKMEMSLIAAQAISILFERLMLEYSTVPDAYEQINVFLRFWPGLIKSASHQTATRGILLSIYGMIDFVAVAQQDKELLLILERFCLENFLENDTLSESEFHGLYGNIQRSVEVTGNYVIHTTASRTVREEQDQLIALLNASNAEDPEMADLLDAYAKSVRRLHSLLIVNAFEFHQVPDIYQTLANLLLEQRVENEILTRYGMESLASMLVILYTNRDGSNDELDGTVSNLVQQLLDFCRSELANSSLDFMRAKYLFCSTLILHIGNMPDLAMDDVTYGTLLDWLIYPPRDPRLEGDSLIEDYLAEMHFVFRRFIQSKHVALPNNRIWKVLVQYKMTTTSLKSLDLEYEKLFGVLLKERIEGYVHCLPVILLHVIRNKRVRKNRVLSLVTAHIKIVENNSTVFDTWMLRFIVFRNMLDLLIDNLTVEVARSYQENRLFRLRSVLSLVTDLRLQEHHFIIIAKSMLSLKEKARGANETWEIESFIIEISKFKYQCEDEQADVEKDENFEGTLIPLPPGPLTHFQHEALNVLV